MEIVVAENKTYLYMSIDPKNDRALSWEEVQRIKDRFFKDLGFIEVYPRRDKIVNKANIRHLFHIKEGFKIPDLSCLEDNSFEIKIHKT